MDRANGYVPGSERGRQQIELEEEPMNIRRSGSATLATMVYSLWLAMTQVAQVAADSTYTSSTTRTTTTVWYGQWWVWAVGVGVFLNVVIALTNRGSRSA